MSSPHENHFESSHLTSGMHALFPLGFDSQVVVQEFSFPNLTCITPTDDAESASEFGLDRSTRFALTLRELLDKSAAYKEIEVVQLCFPIAAGTWPSHASCTANRGLLEFGTPFANLADEFGRGILTTNPDPDLFISTRVLPGCGNSRRCSRRHCLPLLPKPCLGSTLCRPSKFDQWQRSHRSLRRES